MHTYCYRRTQKACRAGLKGWYTAALLLPLGMLCFVAVLPLKAAEETFLCKCASAHARKQTHPSFMQMFLYLKRIPNRATSAPVDAFNLKASRCWLPNCVWSCQPLLAMGVCLVCNYSTDKDTLWFIGKQLSYLAVCRHGQSFGICVCMWRSEDCARYRFSLTQSECQRSRLLVTHLIFQMAYSSKLFCWGAMY